MNSEFRTLSFRLLLAVAAARATSERSCPPPATGRKIDIDVLDLFQIRDERRVEHGALLDNLHNLGMLKQLGAA